MSKQWAQCLSEIRLNFANEIYSIWFADLKADESTFSSETVTLFADSAIKARTIKENYGKKIDEILSSCLGHPVACEIHVEAKESTPFVAPVKDEKPEKQAPTFEQVLENAGILSTLTFDNLVTGQANQMAFTSALQVARGSSDIYNPLIIYGGVGLGKTHLMHAIGIEYLKTHPKARVLCTTAQKYFENFTRAMSSSDMRDVSAALENFQSQYRNLDLLLIDDIQSFTHRSGTQTNFFQVFEQMIPHGKQIVMTSDTYPRNLKDFQERLLSRITQGLVVEIEPPELEMRIQILLKKAERCDLALPHDVAEVIAKHLRSNVRELEGAIQQIRAYTHFHKIPITLDSIKAALRDVFRSSATPVTVESIQQITSEYYHLTLADMQSKKRSAPIAHARQVAMYLAKELTAKSLPEIGALFGGRDHTTVLYAHRKIASERTKIDALRHDLHILEQRIKN